MALKDRIDSKQRAAYSEDMKSQTPSGENDPKTQQLLPQFKKVPKRKPSKSRARTVLVRFALCMSFFVALMAVIIYIPQIFISDLEYKNEMVTPFNANSIDVRKAYIEECGDADFDGDGLSNAMESRARTSVYNPDTDGDGICDGNDFDPLKKSDDIYLKLRDKGYTLSSAYAMNGVILWADDKESCMYGGVMQTPSGEYLFRNFRGWAKFPTGSFAYKYENGTHSELKYREKENAWYIDGDCLVTLTDEKPNIVHKIKIFGQQFYADNEFFGKAMSFVFPEKGWITSKEMWLDDTFISATRSITINNSDAQYTYDINSLERFSRNDIDIDRLTALYKSVKQNKPTLVSLNSKTKGECVFLVYGYNVDGSLLVKSLEGSAYGLINIYPRCARSLDGDNLVERRWFDFKGAGFDSDDGDTICFFQATLVEQPESSQDENENSDASDSTSVDEQSA